MQQLTCRMVWSFSFYSQKKGLNLKRKSWGTNAEKVLKKCGKVQKSVKKCRTDFAQLAGRFSTPTS